MVTMTTVGRAANPTLCARGGLEALFELFQKISFPFDRERIRSTAFPSAIDFVGNFLFTEPRFWCKIKFIKV